MLDWNPHAYDGLPLPHERWGMAVIDRLRISGAETVMDFGCGTGRDVERLLTLLPAGRVVAVDSSEAMLARLRARLANRLDRVTVVRADLREPLPGVGQVDAVMSVATLHWLDDHEAAFRNIAAVLRPGGRFAAEAGGAGNIAELLEVVAEATGSEPVRRHFAAPDDTVRRLADAGFADIEVDLTHEPLLLDGEVLEGFLAHVMLVPDLLAVAQSKRPALVRAIIERMGDPVIDLVRLNIAARRPHSTLPRRRGEMAE